MAAGNSLPVLHGLFLCLCGAFAAPLRRGDWPVIASSNRTEHLLIYRIQSHTNPKRRKFCLKHAGQKSVKEELPEQRKAPKRAVECQLKIQTHIWDHGAERSNRSTRTKSSLVPIMLQGAFCYCRGAHQKLISFYCSSVLYYHYAFKQIFISSKNRLLYFVVWSNHQSGIFSYWQP